jgi:uroporphyrinogen decarboxylase
MWSGESSDPAVEEYCRQHVSLYCRLGYDYYPTWALWLNHPTPKKRITTDTAVADGSQRTWTEEGQGLITSWEDFERFPWDAIRPDPRIAAYVVRHLPAGMKMTLASTVFEHVFENLLGFEGMAYLLYDAPDLVEAVFERWAEIVLDYYESQIALEAVGAIFHADDMGFKTATILSPAMLRRLVLPWLKRFAALAHDHGKMFWLHSCGNLYQQGLMDELIDDVQIDALHSFQDEILPVAAFKARYGTRVATLGGLDMDKLCRLEEAPLRAYIRAVLDACMPGGRFALGSGNTIANFVPLRNFMIMLDEARRWPNR